MPLILIKNENGLFRYGIWHHIEADDFFLERLNLSRAEEAELQNLKARKKSEWLCSRYLLTIVADHVMRGACLKDEYGKPYIEGSDENISISHTFDYTAVIISKKVCGIDIQVVVPKIIAIGPRFINENELKYIPQNNKLYYFHVIWGAKEAMYKCHGKKELDFKKHLEVSPFDFSQNCFRFEGRLHKDDCIVKYSLYAELNEKIMTVYAIEN
ncbi:MAG: 4'-phosphopantetheinyl transferase superfamily protein [Saprospiraceae bacterium]|jgi:4'-phosphopantetheinyl transferase